MKRQDVERDLTFAGFIVITCPLKEDSKNNIRCLHDSSHHVSARSVVLGTKYQVLYLTNIALCLSYFIWVCGALPAAIEAGKYEDRAIVSHLSPSHAGDYAHW